MGNERWSLVKVQHFVVESIHQTSSLCGLCGSETTTHYFLLYSRQTRVTIPMAAGGLCHLNVNMSDDRYCCFSWEKSLTRTHTYSKWPQTHKYTPDTHIPSSKLPIHSNKKLISRFKLEIERINSPCCTSSCIWGTHLGLSNPAACLHEQPSLTTADNHPARPLAN